MHRSVLSRRFAVLVAGLGVAVTALAYPAPATADTATEDAAWLQTVGIPSSGSRWSHFTITDFNQLAARACFADGAQSWGEPSIDDIAYVRIPEQVEAVVVSAEVTGSTAPDGKTCTFAETGTSYPYDGSRYASSLFGGFSLSVESAVDEIATRTGQFGSDAYTTSAPIFTSLDYYAAAELTATGHRETLQPGTVTTPGTPRTTAEIRYAQKVRARSIVHAKKKYKVELKKAAAIKKKSARSKAKSKAKTQQKKRLRNIDASYRRMIATPAATSRPGVVTVRIPFTLDASL